MYMQKTIKKTVTCSGIGLHSGHPVTMTCNPAATDTGIVFRRRDLPGKPTVKVEAANIGNLSYATTLGRDTVSVQTVEHVLSALYALGITNILVELDNLEAPVLDGSAECIVNMLMDAGLEEQYIANRVMQVVKPVEVRGSDNVISVEPHDRLKITYTIDFPTPFIGVQTRSFELSPLAYTDEIAPARTFCLYEEIEYLWKMGLSKGGSLDNAVVFAQDRILNESLRFDDEPVRHKILDLIGDLLFLGHPLLGHIKVYKGGHDLHARFVKTLLAQPAAWQYVVQREAGSHDDYLNIISSTERDQYQEHLLYA